jgi:hypothetical protein
MKYIKFTSYQDNCGLDEIRARVRLISHYLRTTLKFKLEDAHNRLHARSDHHSPLKDGSHDRAMQDMKDFLIEGSSVIHQINFNA